MTPAHSHSYQKPDLIVFDLDGTLTDVDDRAAHLTSITDRFNLPVSMTTYWLMKKAHQVYKRIGVKNERTETIKHGVMNHLCAEKADMFDVLNAAFDAYIPCSILSNGPREWGEKILNRMHMRMFFNQLVFREDMPSLKPDPEPLLRILEVHSFPDYKRGTVWVCGDRASDVALTMNAAPHVRHRMIPVAFEGTKAAKAIATLHDRFNPQQGHIFKTPHHMACAIDPDLDGRIRRAVNSLGREQTHIATFTRQ